MMLLAINSGPAADWSVTRRMMARFMDHHARLHGAMTIIARDIGRNTPPRINDMTAAACTARGEIVGEFLAADTVVIGAPTHRLGITADLTAYFDPIMRAGQVFAFAPEVPEDFFTRKSVHILTACSSGDNPGDTRTAPERQEACLRTIMGFIGIDDVTFIHCRDGGSRTSALTAAERQIDRLFAAEPVTVWS